MRNLAVVARRRRRTQLSCHGERIQASTLDSENGRLFLASSSCRLYWMFLDREETEPCHQSMRLASDDGSDSDTVVGMDYLMEAEAVLVGMESGQLLLAEPASGTVSSLGKLEAGLRSVAVSPDGALVALGTGAGQLLVMTTEWDLVYELGIGSNIPPLGLEIIWRLDGNYFLTHERDLATDFSLVKVWEREGGVLHSSCSPLQSSHACVSWHPRGARIAVACTRSKTERPPLLVILERNGLEKSSFELAAPCHAQVEGLGWNSSGEVLHVVLRCHDWDAIQLWSCSNYHWYLKQEWRYAPEDGVKLAWHPEAPLCAIPWTALGGTEVVTMCWKSAVHGYSTALNVDGQAVGVTLLARSLIPPPMFLFKLRFSQAVNALAFASTGQESGVVAASLSDGSISIVSLCNMGSSAGLELEASRLQHFDAAELRDLTFTSATSLCGVARADDKLLLELELRRAGDAWFAEDVRQVSLGMRVVALASTGSELVVQLEDGSFVGSPGSTPAAKFPRPCPWLKLVESEQGLLIIGLDETGHLQVAGTPVCDDCTSFTVHATRKKTSKDVLHLVYTTKQSLLHVVGLEGQQLVASGSPNARQVWERGAVVVGSLSGRDVGVVLQTGRGNLETVFPRGLVLQAIGTALADLDFKEAIVCARRHRIDLNVIVDFLGEDSFSCQAAQFVKQVGALSLVTDLVSSLRKENVLRASYGSAGGSETSSNKVQVVLQALRDCLEKDVVDSSSRELCLLTILARSDPPMLEDALKRVKRLREEELRLDNKVVDGKLAAEAAVKHLIWLADSEAVFNSALGLYDLHLAAMVASHSQRDPKEFLPFLEELEGMPEYMMRHKIDLRLHKYESALRNLGDAHFTDSLTLIKRHPELFPVGLSIFRGGSQRRQMLEEAGEYLLAQGQFASAAISFCACSQVEKALSAYRAGGMWQGVLAVAGQLNMSAGDMSRLTSDILEELQAMGRPREAARVALDYCKDPEAAIRLLVDARDWVEVLRLCHLYSRGDLLDCLVKPCAQESAVALVAQFEEGVEKIGKYVARFMAVRQRRLLLEAKLGSGGGGGSKDEDAVSETSSNLSGMSVYSSRGSARTHATKSKSGRVRPGSPEEEVALAEHLKAMDMSAQAAEEELCSLLQLLVLTGQEGVARRLQRTAVKYDAAQCEAVGQVTGRQQASTAKRQFEYLALVE